jgi:hypothetical protein
MASDYQILQEMRRLQQLAAKSDNDRKQALEAARTASTPAQSFQFLEKAKEYQKQQVKCIAEREIWRKQLTQRDERQREMNSVSPSDLEKERIIVSSQQKTNEAIRKASKDSAQALNPHAHTDKQNLTIVESRIKEKLEKNNNTYQSLKESTLSSGEEKIRKRLEQEASFNNALKQRNHYDR